MSSKPFHLLTSVMTALVIGAAPLSAQWRADLIPPIEVPTSQVERAPVPCVPEASQARPASDLTLALSGAAGAVVGGLGASILGYHLDRNLFGPDCRCDDPGAWGFFGGWFLGSALAAPLSVHAANGRQGSLSTAYLASGALAGVGMAGLIAAGSPEGAFVIAGAPLVQVLSAVLIERRTNR